MRYTSPELFHFVGRKDPEDHQHNYETLKKILLEKRIIFSSDTPSPGWGPLTCWIDLSKELLNGEMLAPGVVCFCDIPVESLRVHVSKYGPFGFSLDRHHLIRYGTRPVMYIPHYDHDWEAPYGKSLIRDIEAVYRSFRTHVKEQLGHVGKSRTMEHDLHTLEEATVAAESTMTKEFLAFIKPFDSQLDENHPDNFYMEREWRRLGYVCFELKHIRRILVPEEYCARLRAELPEFTSFVKAIERYLQPSPDATA